MKNNILFIFLFAVFSCTDTSDTSVNKLSDLSVESLEQFVPINYLEENSKVIYRNENGEEIIFEIVSSTTTEMSKVNDLEYDRELKSYSFKNDNLNYSLNILMTAQYYDRNTILESIDCSLFTGANNGWIPMIRLDGSGNTLLGSRGDMTLGQRTFYDVISSLEPATSDFKFSKIFYNYEFGFVGFHDAENQLWYLKQYVE
ncbi:MAG: hypothetical protein KI786_04140 [Mameliella sp.]|nr:hypothetical protein [Phaeodactylibacter sp.]